MDDQNTHETKTAVPGMSLPPPPRRLVPPPSSEPVLPEKEQTHEDVFDVEQAFKNPDASSGVIVSDQKDNRPTVGQRLKSAFTEWWGSTKETSDKITTKVAVKPEKKTVAPVETRTEVVREATKNTIMAPRSDHHIAIQKFRTFKQDVARLTDKQTALKTKPVAPDPTWTHTLPEEESEKPPEKKIHVPLETPDLRATMVAPVVAEKIQVPPKAFLPEERLQITEEFVIPQDARQVVIPPTFKKQTPVPPAVPVPQTKPVPPPAQAPQPEVRIERKPIPTSPTPTPKAVPVYPPATAPTVPTPSEVHIERKPIPVPQEAIQEPEPLRTPVIAPPIEPVSQKETPKEVHASRLEQIRASIQSARRIAEPVPEPEVAPTPHIEREVRETPASIPQTESPDGERPEFHSTIHIEEIEKQKEKEREQSDASVSHDEHVTFTLLGWIVFGGVGVVVLISIIGGVMYMRNGQQSGDVPQVTTPQETFFQADEQTKIPLGDDAGAFLSNLSNEIQNAKPGITQLYPTLVQSGTERIASSQDFFENLHTKFGASTVRALNPSFMVGSVNVEGITAHEPYLVLKSYDFDTLFAGLLAWEPTMQADLAPLFGTGTQEGNTFTDAIQNNKSIRILKNKDGNEMLVYSFVTKDTVIITTSTSALSVLIQKF